MVLHIACLRGPLRRSRRVGRWLERGPDRCQRHLSCSSVGGAVAARLLQPQRDQRAVCRERNLQAEAGLCRTRRHHRRARFHHSEIRHPERRRALPRPARAFARRRHPDALSPARFSLHAIKDGCHDRDLARTRWLMSGCRRGRARHRRIK